MIETKFKHTEIGLIPHDWEVKPLGDIAVLINGRAYSQSELLKSGKYKVLRVGNFFSNDSWYYSDLELEEKMYCNEGDLLYAWSCTYGAYIWNEPKTIFHYHIWKVLPNNVDKKFLYFILNNDVDRQRKTSQGSTMSHITKSFMEKHNFVLPPTLAEQERIADALSKIDSLIVGLDELLEKKRAIKTGTMQQLLTGKKRLKGFTGEWVEKTIEELGDLTGAGVDKKSYQDETPVRLVNYLDVFRRDYIYNNELDFWVTAKETKKIQCNVLRGDVFFTPSSEMPYDIALSAVAMEDMPNVCYSYHIYRLRFREDIDELYRAYMFKSKAFYEQANQTCEGSGKRYVISLTKFKQMTVYYPSDKGEQHAIASILSAMDTEIASLEQKRDKYIAIKQGMMQQLLTGKIRLV